MSTPHHQENPETRAPDAGAERPPFWPFVAVWVGQLVSGVGSGLTAFALAIHVYGRTLSATSVGLLALCAFGPPILISPLGGVLADRHERRLMMAAADTGQAVGLVLLIVLLLRPPTPLWTIFAGAAVSSTFVGILEPAYKATVSDLVDPDRYARAAGMVQLASGARFLLSPALAAVLMLAVPMWAVLAVDAGTAVVTIAVTLSVRHAVTRTSKRAAPAAPAPTAGPRRGFVAELWATGRTLSATGGLWPLVLLMTATTFFMGLLQTLAKPLILGFASPTAAGVLESVGALGIVGGSVAVSTLRGPKRFRSLLAGGLATAGIGLAAMGARPLVWWTAASASVFFCSLPMINTGAEVLLRANVPNQWQGRVWGLVGIVSQMGFVVAYLVAGPLADGVFNPLLRPGGPLAASAGRWWGVGPTRGIGLLFLAAGLALIAVAGATGASPAVGRLEDAVRTVDSGTHPRAAPGPDRDTLPNDRPSVGI